MRTRITHKPWFGPRRRLLTNWGLRPVSWEGWLSSAVFAALEILNRIVLAGAARIVVAVALVPVFLPLIALTTDPSWRARLRRRTR